MTNTSAKLPGISIDSNHTDEKITLEKVAKIGH